MDDSDTDEAVMQTMMNGDTFLGTIRNVSSLFSHSIQNQKRNHHVICIFLRGDVTAFDQSFLCAVEIELYLTVTLGLGKEYPQKTTKNWPDV